MKDSIQSVIRTLNSIPVSGKTNLDKMLGCILALERLSVALEVTEEKPNEEEVNKLG